MDSLVEWSVAEANRLRGAQTFEGMPCPDCGKTSWHCRNGIDPKYASEFNPGEFCEFTCAACGYSYEEQS